MSKICKTWVNEHVYLRLNGLGAQDPQPTPKAANQADLPSGGASRLGGEPAGMGNRAAWILAAVLAVELVEQNAKEVALMSAPILRIAHHIVTEAIDCQASAIQIELVGGRMTVDYHCEGEWHRQKSLSGHIFPPVATRYKLWADVDLLNRHYPLKGQFPLVHRRRHYSIDVISESWLDNPRVTLCIVAGEEADAEWDGPEELYYI